MRNIHKQLITSIIPTLFCALSVTAMADELDSLESISAVCRFSDPVENPFLAQDVALTGREDEVYDASAIGEVPSVSNRAETTRSDIQTTSGSRRVYTSRSANAQVRAQIEVYHGHASPSGEGAEVHRARASDAAGENHTHARGASVEAEDVAETERADGGQELSEASLVEAETVMRYAQSRRRHLARTYETSVGASQFRVVSYDPASETLIVSLSDPMELNNGVATITLPNDNSLMFAVNADAADYIETQWRTGEMELWLRYELISRQDMTEAYCTQNDVGGPELVGALLEASLIEPMRNRTLTSMETDRAVRERCSLRAEASRDTRGDDEDARVVDVHTLESFGSDTMSEAEASMLTVFAELVLGECYFDAQMSNAALEGAVVVNFELSPDGAMNAARLSIDALRNEQFRTCAIEAFGRSRIPRVAEASALDTRMTLIFSPISR